MQTGAQIHVVGPQDMHVHIYDHGSNVLSEEQQDMQTTGIMDHIGTSELACLLMCRKKPCWECDTCVRVHISAATHRVLAAKELLLPKSMNPAHPGSFPVF